MIVNSVDLFLGDQRDFFPALIVTGAYLRPNPSTSCIE
jgi:hypothetical protein